MGIRKFNIDADILLKCLSDHMTLNDIAKMFGCSISLVQMRMREYRISYADRNQVYKNGTLCRTIRPDIDKQWLIDNWINTNKSLSTLAKEECIPDSVLESRSSKYGLRKQRKYNINTEKLFNINDPEVWYTVGLIATDGYLRYNSDVVEIGLVGDDENDLLERMREYFESNYPIRRIKNVNTVILSTKGIQSFLNEKFNIPLRKKTFYLKTPDIYISDDCIKAYLLGCLDGDGNISSKRMRIRLVTASEDFIDGIKNIIDSYSPVESKKYYMERKGKRYPGILIGGRSRCSKFIEWMLSYSPKLFLKRKNKIYKEILSHNEEVMQNEVNKD